MRELDLINREKLTSWLLKSEASTFIRVLEGLAAQKADTARDNLLESARCSEALAQNAMIAADESVRLTEFVKLIENMRQDRNPDNASEPFPFVIPKQD